MTAPTAWLASFPKSGNTWVRALLDALQYGDHPAINAMTGSGASNRMEPSLGLSLSDLDPVQTSKMLRLSWAVAENAGQRYRWRKTHQAWVPAADGYPIPWQPAPAKVIYIVRDPRAVAVSWAHHLGITIAEAVVCMRTDIRPAEVLPGINSDTLTSWSNHVRTWLDDCSLPTVLIRYETLVANPHAEVARLSDFLEMQATEDEIDAAIERCSFANLAAREIVEGFIEAAAPDRPFFRKGQADAWQGELPDDLADEICSDHGDVMRRLGYLD